MANHPAIMLLSGGLDSATALAWAISQDYKVQSALAFTYGQHHVREVEAASALASHYQVPFQSIALTPLHGSKLTDLGDVPRGRDLAAIDERIAPTYVPNRNLILIAYAAAHALLGDAHILIGGWNAADAANYPDCRDVFLESAQRTLQLATLRDLLIVRPLIQDDKPAIVRRALQLGVPIELTWTCYLGQEQACGLCDACQLRIAAFRAIGMIDPLAYEIELDWRDCKPYIRGKA